MNVAKLLGRAEQKNTKRASETRFEPVMKNQRHAREVLYAMMMMMMMMIVFGFSNPAWSDDAQPNNTSSSSAIGTPCIEDPTCIVVGETHMLEWRSPAPKKIIVVCIHGLGLCARAYKRLAEELSAAGIDGYGVNVRGFGPDRDKPDRAKLNCIDTVDDIKNLLCKIRKEHPDYKILLVGESMGGALAIRIGAENPGLIDGLVCSAPAWKLLRMRQTAVKGAFELFLYPGNQPGPAGKAVMHQATTDTELTKHWLTDPSHKLKLTFKEATSFLSFVSKTDSYAKQLTKPILVIQGLNDRLVSPKAVARLVRDIPSRNKTFLIDGHGEHLVLEEGNFSKPLLEKLVDWMKTKTTDPTQPVYLTEVISDRSLSPKQTRQLKSLRQLAN